MQTYRFGQSVRTKTPAGGRPIGRSTLVFISHNFERTQLLPNIFTKFRLSKHLAHTTKLFRHIFSSFVCSRTSLRQSTLSPYISLHHYSTVNPEALNTAHQVFKHPQTSLIMCTYPATHIDSHKHTQPNISHRTIFGHRSLPLPTAQASLSTTPPPQPHTRWNQERVVITSYTMYSS